MAVGEIIEAMVSSRYCIVIPTLQTRPDYLVQAIRSALDVQGASVMVVSPTDPQGRLGSLVQKVRWVKHNSGLAEAINHAVGEFPREVTHFSWIGDDDLMESFDAKLIIDSMGERKLLVARCRMIGDQGEVLGVHKPKLRGLTPIGGALFANPIAQPATIIEVDAFRQAKGIDTQWQFAFDHELFLRLISLHGRPLLSNQTIASYRIHDDTLSQTNRLKQLKESAAIRYKHSPNLLKPIVRMMDAARERAMRLLGLL